MTQEDRKVTLDYANALEDGLLRYRSNPASVAWNWDHYPSEEAIEQAIASLRQEATQSQ